MIRWRENRILIIAIIISLLIHLIVLFLLFTFKPTHKPIIIPNEKKDLHQLKIIKVPTPPAQKRAPIPITPQPVPPPQKTTAPQLPPKQQPQKKEPLINPVSQKEAETLEGSSISDFQEEQTGIKETAEQTENESVKEPSNKTLEKQLAPKEIIKEIPSKERDETPKQQEKEKDEYAAIETEKITITQETEEREESIQLPKTSSTPREKREPYAKKEKSLKIQESSTSSLKPIIRKKYKKAQEQLAALNGTISRCITQAQEDHRKDNSPAARVARQQTELQTMSYRQKIDQCIYESAYYAGPVHSDMNIDQRIKAIITIDKNGNLITFRLAEPTPSPLINNYLKRIISQATFPPLPRHLGLDAHQFPWNPVIKVRKGLNKLTYYYS